MRKLSVVAALLLLACVSFAQVSKTNPVDLEAEEAAINALMDKFDKAMEALDVSTMASLFTEDALACGTDPSEFWNKQEFFKLWEQASSNPIPEYKYLGDRIVKVASGGNSAMVVTQYIIEWSPKIPWRQTYHCVKMNDDWMIHFMNVAFIPKNEDIKRINDAIE